MNLKANLETKLTTPVLGIKPVDELARLMRECSDALIALDELCDYLGHEARVLRLYSRMNLLDPEQFAMTVTLVGHIDENLDVFYESIDSGNGIRALSRKLEAWIKVEPIVVWENGVEGLRASVKVLHQENVSLRSMVQLYLGGDEPYDEARRAVRELRALLFAIVETL